MVINYKRGFTLFLSLLFCFSCSNKNLEQVGREIKVTPVKNSTLKFDGVESVTSITATTAIVNWSDVTEASNYYVWQSTTNEPESIIAAVASPASQYQVTGLSTKTTYAFKVTATDSKGLQDVNTVTKQITTE